MIDSCSRAYSTQSVNCSRLLTGAHTTESKAEHLAHTAHTGMWLLLIGTALLIVMRAFDVWLMAHKWMAAAQDPAANADAMESLSKAEPWLASLGANAGAPLANVFRAAPWLEVSFFLIVPLALNALVLCPIIIRRALRARAAGAAHDYAGKAATSIAVATVVAVASIGYLLMIALRK